MTPRIITKYLFKHFINALLSGLKENLTQTHYYVHYFNKKKKKNAKRQKHSIIKMGGKKAMRARSGYHLIAIKIFKNIFEDRNFMGSTISSFGIHSISAVGVVLLCHLNHE